MNVNINVRRVYIYNYSPSLTSRNFSSFFEQIERLTFQLWKQKWHYQLCRLSTFKMHQLLDVATYLPQTSTHITHNGMGVTKSFKTWWNVCWGSQAAGANPQRTSHIILIQRRIDFKKTARDALEANWCGKHCRSTILRELAAFSVSRKFESLFSQFPSTHPVLSSCPRSRTFPLNMWHPSKDSEESGGKRWNVCCWSAKRVCSPQAILTREDATALAKN